MKESIDIAYKFVIQIVSNLQRYLDESFNGKECRINRPFLLLILLIGEYVTKLSGFTDTKFSDLLTQIDEFLV